THAIVALASCLMMLISQYAFPDAGKFDASRVAAGVVSGIGFLGAGLIFAHEGSIYGLTTAAGVWATSGIGMAFGAGMYALGTVCGLLMYIVENVYQKIFSFNPPYSLINVAFKMDHEGTISDINEVLLKLGYNHSENKITSKENYWQVDTMIRTRKDVSPKQLKDELSEIPHLIEICII
ncbi:MAG: MgtC/SapB family protein, partial [Erysipelotrichaceae bacterium]|nr:MgtC/SapB family protein [Erysipelotrichaceae bacterium]